MNNIINITLGAIALSLLFLWVNKKYALIGVILLLTGCANKPDINKIMFACDSEILEYRFSSESIRLEFKCKE
jgi:hypothetical protein